MTEPHTCRKCALPFLVTAGQVRKRDWICRDCRNAAQRANGAARRAAGTFDYERSRQWCREWRERNLEAQRERERGYHGRNLEKSRKRARQYQIDNAASVSAAVCARGKRTRQATPAWADLPAIRAFYRARPEGMSVDHIIPLRGKIVSGLHVLGNLQYLDRIENIKKGNRFDG